MILYILLPLNSSGAIQCGVPTIDRADNVLHDKPKSPKTILPQFPSINILSPFKSRFIIFL